MRDEALRAWLTSSSSSCWPSLRYWGSALLLDCRPRMNLQSAKVTPKRAAATAAPIRLSCQSAARERRVGGGEGVGEGEGEMEGEGEEI